MSEYGDDEDEWFEDQWYVEDVENLSDTLVSSAYGHEPPFAPEGYDAYDSDIDEYYTDGDDDYFDGPPGSPSPPPTPLPKDFPGLPRISSNLVLLTPPTPNIPTPPTPQPAEVAECLSKIEIKFREAMAGKKFYGEAEEGDEKILKIGVRRRRRRDLAGAGGSKGEEGMRKRRKVERPSEIAKATPPVDGGISNVGDSIGIVEIGGRGDAGSEEDEEDNDDGSAEGYDSDGLDGEEEKSERRRSLREEVEIRPPGKLDGGKSVGGAGRRREKAMVESGVGAGGKRNGEKRRTPLR